MTNEERYEYDLQEFWAEEYDQYMDAIEAFEQVAEIAKVHGGEETNALVVAKAYKLKLENDRAIHCGFCKYHRQENASGRPKHRSWKDCVHTGKRYGNHVDKGRIAYDQ